MDGFVVYTIWMVMRHVVPNLKTQAGTHDVYFVLPAGTLARAACELGCEIVMQYDDPNQAMEQAIGLNKMYGR